MVDCCANQDLESSGDLEKRAWFLSGTKLSPGPESQSKRVSFPYSNFSRCPGMRRGTGCPGVEDRNASGWIYLFLQLRGWPSEAL